MKYGILLAMGLLMGSNLRAADVEIFLLSPDGVFAPKGFDDNDDVVIVLSGFFYNSCFKLAPNEVSINVAQRQIFINQRVYSMDKCQNGMMMIPYTSVVNLGILPVGNYEIMVSDGKGGQTKRGEIPVGKARDSAYSPDSVLYAPVNEVDFTIKRGNSGAAQLVLKGTFGTNCIGLGEVKTRYTGNVVEVLPVAKLAKDTSKCKTKPHPYRQVVELKDFPKGEVLLHVRSMGGQSTNRVITFLDRYSIQTAR